jgi:RHS repeat-associated protein
VYFSDSQNNRIRKVGTDGIIRTVAGTGNPGGGQCFLPGLDPAPAGEFERICGEGIPATRALLRNPTGLTVGPDGTVYFAQQVGGEIQARIRRIDPAGFIYSFAGGDVPTTQLNEGGSAKQAQLGSTIFTAMTMGPDGSLYFTSSALGIPAEQYSRVRRVLPDGRITTVLGDGTVSVPLGDNGPARSARVGTTEGVAVTAAGDLLVSDDFEVRLVSPPLPGLAAGQTVIASEDGSELYVFSPAGRQLLTLRQLTGDTIYVFAYNNAHQLVSIRDRHGLTTEIQRDGTGKVTGVVSPDGYRTSLVIGPNGELQGVTDPSGNTAHLVAGDGGLPSSSTDPNGSTSNYAFDSTGRLTRVTDPDGGFLSRNLTSASTVAMTSSSGTSASVGAQRDSTGAVTQTGTLPSGAVLQSTTTLDNTTTTHAPDGTTYTVIRTPDPRFGMQVPLEQVVTRLPSGLQRSDRHTRTAVLSDSLNLLSLTTQIDSVIKNGRAEVQTYDRALRRLTTKTRAGRIDVALFDSVGNQVRDSIPSLLARRYTLDGGGRLVQVTQGARTVRAFFGSKGLQDSTSDELGRRMAWQYDAAGHEVQRVRAGGDTLRWEYDSAGHKTAVIPPGRPAHRFAFNFRGALDSYRPPPVVGESSAVLWRYTDGGQPAQLLRPDGKNVSWSYDATGRRTITAFGDDTIRVSYNAVTGEPATFTGQEGQTVAQISDGALLTQRSWSGPVSGVVKAQYDSNFRVAAVLVNGNPVTSYGYDLDGAITSAGGLSITRDPSSGLMTGTTLGQITTSIGHNGHGEDSVVVTQAGSTTLIRWVYGRDPTGRVTSVSETINGVVSNVVYGYDSTGRLISVTKDGSLAASYEYDQNGNRLRAVYQSGVQPASYDVQDRLTSYGSAEYHASPAGNVAEKIVGNDTTRYSFDALSELRSVRLPNGTVVSYVYDGNGRRVGKRVNGAMVQGFLYSGDRHPVAELDATGVVIRKFVYATRPDVPDFLIQNGTTYRIIADRVGSVRLVVDAQTGVIAQQIDYDAFGRIISNSSPGFQPLGFGGGFADTETGLIQLGLRFYDPETGRWISRDPLLFDGGSSNLYTYAAADPVNRADRTGTFLGALYAEMALGEELDESQKAREVERIKTQISITAACVSGAIDVAFKKGTAQEAGDACRDGIRDEVGWDLVETGVGFGKVKDKFLQVAYQCMFGVVEDVVVPDMVSGKLADHEDTELAYACLGGAVGQGFELLSYAKHPIYGPLFGALAKVILTVSRNWAEATMDQDAKSP